MKKDLSHVSLSLGMFYFFICWLSLYLISTPRFAGFLLSCLGISLAAARGRGIKPGALLGVV